jgi:hypothetical protein
MNLRNTTMSLRCSLLGHDYGDAEIEREREEQGSEVVVTVREFEECDRCGSRSVISENKEVTALDSPAPDLESAESSELVDSSGGADSPAQSNSAGAGAGVAAEGDDAEIMTDATESEQSEASRDADAPSQSAESSDAGASSESAAATAGSHGETGQSAADDDGVILTDDGNETTGRQPGEWPEAETTHPAEADEGDHTPWPEVGQEDEGFDAEPGGGSADVEFGGGLTPESAPEVEDDEEEVEFVNADGDRLKARDAGRSDPQPELSSGISAGADAPSLSGPADDPDVDAEFVCPECDYREGVAGSSLRAGDICPECSKGYLAQE